MLGFAEQKIKPKLKLRVDSDSIKYQERVRKLEALHSIKPFKDDNKIFRKLPAILFPYQQQFIEAALNSAYECLVWEKSRRVGATHAVAAFAVLEASKGKGAKNFFYIGTSLAMARDFISSCAYWCRNFNLVARYNDKPIIDKEDESILVLRITLKTGKRVEALSSKPESMRGRQGHCLIDESAFVANLKEFIKACMAMQIWRCKVFILSTHDGVNNEFNQFCEEIKNNIGTKKSEGFYIQRTTLKQAVKDGLYERICLMEDLPYNLETQREWLERLYNQAGSSASEEYDAIPRTENPNSIFKPEMFQRINKEDLPKSFDILGRAWDWASTDKDTSCYSVGLLVGIKGDKKYILGWDYCRKNPGDSEDFYLSITRDDGKNVFSVFEEEGGSTSLKYSEYIKKELRGFIVKGIKPDSAKMIRIMPCQRDAKNGNYFILDTHWTDDFLKTVCKYEGQKEPLVTDTIDALGLAHNTFTKKINHLLTS